MKCCCDPCKEEVYSWCQWGTKNKPLQEGNFCKQHSDELWLKLEPMLKANTAWYRIDAPKDDNA